MRKIFISTLLAASTALGIGLPIATAPSASAAVHCINPNFNPVWAQYLTTHPGARICHS